MSPDDKVFYGLLAIIGGVYVAGVGTNSIWTTHESYYAVAVQEMLNSGNWLNITFNGEPRLNKPPLTYWLMAVSATVFGLKEWALRLPILLSALGTLGVVYQLGKLLFNRQVGRWAVLLLAVSLQFAWLKHYASPEIPLTFFFTLTLYGLIQGWRTQKASFLVLGFGSLALTLLTKGWPYFFVIYAIFLVYLGIYTRFRLSQVIQTIPRRWFFWGNLLALAVGLSWIGWMYFYYGQEVLEVLHFETSQRMIRSNQGNFWRQWFFYPEVALWSFFPGSLALYYAVYFYAKRGMSGVQPLALPIAWLGVMLLGFTLAKGKLPSYLLQAHPAMALLCGYFIVHSTHLPRRVWRIVWGVPTGAAIVVAISLIVAFDLSVLWYVVLSGLVLLVGWCYARRDRQYAPALAVASTAMVLGVLFVSLYPSLERHRPYWAIQDAIKDYPLTTDSPLIIENRFIHNLPFYTNRQVLRDQPYSWKDIRIIGQRDPVLALVDADYTLPSGYQVLWKGWLYRKGSESHGFRFIWHCWKAQQGDYQHFKHYQLLFCDPHLTDQPLASTPYSSKAYHP